MTSQSANTDNSGSILTGGFVHNFGTLASIKILFALYTNSFVRSFASSIKMMGSSLVVSHNRAK